MNHIFEYNIDLSKYHVFSTKSYDDFMDNVTLFYIPDFKKKAGYLYDLTTSFLEKKVYQEKIKNVDYCEIDDEEDDTLSENKFKCSFTLRHISTKYDFKGSVEFDIEGYIVSENSDKLSDSFFYVTKITFET